jgi:predicted O-methyltransferase YrrM
VCACVYYLMNLLHLMLACACKKKENYLAYYDVAMELVRAGGAICFDDTLWSGRVVEDSGAFDAETEAIRALNNLLSQDPRVLR